MATIPTGMCTAGSTGRPNWARLQHSPMLSRARMGVEQARLSHNTQQVTLEPGLGVGQAGLGCSTNW